MASADPLFDVSSLKVVITGAGRGIGRSLALGLAARGAQVALLSRTKSELESVAGEVGEAGGVGEAFPVDLRDPEAIQRTFEAIHARFGSLDVLVNNAGMNIRTPSLEVTPEVWRKILSTNLDSAFFCSQAAAKIMKEGGGSIINMGSVAGIVAIPTGAPYAASKGAMSQLTRALALEWAPLGIRVNCIAPWYFRTPLTAHLLDDPAYLKRITDVTPMARVGELEELVGVTCFLASKASAFITGQVLAVDGGMSIQGMGMARG